MHGLVLELALSNLLNAIRLMATKRIAPSHQYYYYYTLLAYKNWYVALPQVKKNVHELLKSMSSSQCSARAPIYVHLSRCQNGHIMGTMSFCLPVVFLL